MKKLNRKKIVFITPFYPIKHRNDLFEDTKAVYYLLKSFAKENDVLIIHSFMHGFKYAWKKLTSVIPIKVHYKDFLHVDDYGNNVLFFENLLLLPKSIKTFQYFNKKYAELFNSYCIEEEYCPEIGVVHFPTYYVDFLGSVKKFPKTIAVLHSFDIKNIKTRKNIEYWKGYFKNFTSIGFRSYVIKKEFENIFGYVDNTFMCLSGIPEEYISIELKDSTYNISDNINIIFAGRLDHNKNVAKSILALDKIKKKVKFSFTIVGDGEEKKNLEEMTLKFRLEDQINFTGKISREKTFKLMQKADIFIMVSKKETLGLVYLEAMAAGCLVIGTKGQGIDGIIVDGENGFLTDSSDENTIYQTIDRVINLSPNEQRKIRENAKNTVKSLSDTSLSKEYYSNICSVIREDNW
ncbi:glycosyltransferase [Cytobacillus firmus]|uniref:glycosyltransferase n=1 Tax=Cytobacillus firmus TaxID=1399 RepID=UPI002163249B|nr:glycosyltransferase [Cytobacillus firmus]MCS0670395.1 glycosyltransferase [Cytobacillus firmus]